MQQLSPRMPLRYTHFGAWLSKVPDLSRTLQQLRTPKRTHKTEHYLEMGQERGWSFQWGQSRAGWKCYHSLLWREEAKPAYSWCKLCGSVCASYQEGRVIAYGSWELSDMETRDSQIEDEALPVVWTCDHYDRFVNGVPHFEVITDHKPFVNIWQKLRPLHRTEKWELHLQPYQLTIKYQPGRENPADYMSRQSVQRGILHSHGWALHECCSVTGILIAMLMEEVKWETAKESTLQAVVSVICVNKRHDLIHYHYGGMGQGVLQVYE